MGFVSSAVGTVMGNRTDSGDIDHLNPAFDKDGNVNQNFTIDGSQDATTRKFGAIADNLFSNANNGAQAQTRGQQQNFVDMLNAQAQGQGPSVSQTLMNQALDRNVASNNALAASAKGNINPALLMRNAMNANANAGQQASGQAMVGRQQEQLNAEGMLGNALGQMRGQDQQNSAMMNQLGLGAQTAGMQGAIANMTGRYGGYQTGADVARANTANTSKSMGGLANGIGGMLGLQGLASGGVIPEEQSFQGQQGNGLGSIASHLPNLAFALAAGMKDGGKVPGKAMVSGDSKANDNVLALLSPGEIVVPRSKASNPEKAKAFIEELKKSSPKKSTPVEFSEILKAQQELNRKLSQLMSKKGK